MDPKSIQLEIELSYSLVYLSTHCGPSNSGVKLSVLIFLW